MSAHVQCNGKSATAQPADVWGWRPGTNVALQQDTPPLASRPANTKPRYIQMPKSQKPLAPTKPSRPATRSTSPKASPRLHSKASPASPRLSALSAPVSPRLAARVSPAPALSPRLSARAAPTAAGARPSKRHAAPGHIPEQPLPKSAKSNHDAAAKETSINIRQSLKRDPSPKQSRTASSGKDAERSSRRSHAVAAASAAQRAPPLRVDVVRCLGWLPSAIVSLVVDSKNRFVAALRDNGWLELWCCSGSHWAVTSTFIVGAPSGIRCVLFMPPLCNGDSCDRLFTADLSGNIVEWDVLTQSPCAHSLSFGGSVWALAAVSASADTIAVACQDGGTRLFSVAQPQSIILNRVVVRHSSPCVCVAAATSGSLLATGYEDGSCRVTDILGNAPSVTFRTLPSGDQVKNPRVWAVAFCGEEHRNVAAADANGSVHVFDLSSGTLQQSMHISKNGDMLCLVSDGCGGLVAASVNAKVFHITSAHGVSAGSPWRVSSACRLHTHDVYSLALFSKNTLLSGGLDCQLAVYALERGARSLRAVRKVMPLPRHGSVSSSSSGRHNVLAQISGSGVLDLFRGDIGIGSDAASELHEAAGGLGFELAVRVEPPKDSAWQLVALSGDCKYMALTCSRSIVVFACNISAAMPSITRLFACEIAEAPSSIVFVGHSFVFVGDCQGSIHMFEIASASKTHEIFPSAAFRAAIVFMSSSRDGQFVAAYDAAHRLHCINAETNHVIALDPVAGIPTALCWHPQESLVAVSILGNSVALLPADSFSGHREWSAPTPLVSLASSCAGLMFHPSRADVLLLWGAEWIASYDPHALSETNHQLIKQKFRRRSSGTTTCGNVSVCSKYSPLVFVGLGGGHSIIVLEQPWAQVLSAMGPVASESTYKS